MSGAEDLSGKKIDIMEDLGRAKGNNIISSAKIDDGLKDKLYFELNTVDTKGEKREYRLQLQINEIN